MDSFELNLRSMLDPEFTAIDNGDDIDEEDPFVTATQPLVDAKPQIKQLLETLRRIRNGNTKPNDLQRKAIRESGDLIKLLITYAEYMGGMAQDISGVRDESGAYAKQAQYFASHQRTYKEKILPLLEELEGALRLLFDKPRGGIG